MKFKTAEEIRDYLWPTLHLDTRSIVFHMIDIGDGRLYFRPDMITTPNDFYDSDGLYDLGEACYDERELNVFSVESYMIGNGESDRADYADIEVLEDIADESPRAMVDFLNDIADCLVVLNDVKVENPAYDPDYDDDDDEEI